MSASDPIMSRQKGKEKLLLTVSRSTPSTQAVKGSPRLSIREKKTTVPLQVAGAILTSRSQLRLPETVEVRHSPRSSEAKPVERHSLGGTRPGRTSLHRATSSPHKPRGKRLSQCVSLSKVGTAHGRPKPYNQDSYAASRLDVPLNPALLLVCDGHGELGHAVSSYVAAAFPQILTEALLREDNKRYDDAEGALREAFRQANEGLRTNVTGGKYSGSTCIAVLVQRDFLTCAHVGDSKAVLCRRESSQCIAVPLSHEHKPSDPEERSRIEGAGGRVRAINQSGALRIWFQDEDSPGLAMSRALGDFDAQQIGVIATPGDLYSDVSTTVLSNADLFIIVASDGLWEYMSGLEAVLIVEELRLQGLHRDSAQALVDAAVKRWECEDSRVDDITVVVGFLDS